MGTLDARPISEPIPEPVIDGEKDKTKDLKVEELLQLILIELQRLNGSI